MIEFLKDIDATILLFINGFHNPFTDSLMWFLSGKVILVPIIIITYFFLWKKYNWKGLLLITISIICTIILTDQLSVHLFKEVFLRYRPSHNTEISPLLHFYEFKPGELYLGGQYGFISSHAANYFGFIGLATPLFYLKNKGFFTFLVSMGLLIGLSRIYLGVHYPSDVVVGAIFGFAIGMFVYAVIKKNLLKFSIQK
ncbi:MAG: phosphatase PAP2 family protein [Flavobacteriia bacterium]|nr:phosphatase PAP2 family protein [Flavobacteriia bacterium]